jgi:hypothetical protein
MDFGAIVTLILAGVGALGWLYRLEGRITTEVALREALQQRLDGFEQRIYESLRRIEDRLDEKVNK